MAPPGPGPSKAGTGRVAIVTGGSKGIGLEVVRGLMSHNHHVVIAARDTAACEQAMQQLSQEGLPGSCTTACLDLEDFQSVRRFATQQAAQLHKEGSKLAVLVNNAGVMGVGYTASGMDRHILCNHLGPFLLTHLLGECMTEGSRVVNVASRAHYNGRLTFDTATGDLQQRPKLWWLRYSDSKLANVVFTAELQRRWGPKGITSVSVSPGFVSTNIFNNLPWPLSTIAGPLVPLVGRTPAKGAETAIWAAVTPDLPNDAQHVFVHDCKPLKPAAAALDVRLGSLLWQWSERLCGLELAPRASR